MRSDQSSQSSELASVLDLCSLGWRLGLAELSGGHVGSGLRLLLNSIGYWRVPVLSILLEQSAALAAQPASKRQLRALDVGSPKIFAFALAAARRLEVVATDLQDSDIHAVWAARWQRRFPGRSEFCPRFADARALPFSDSSFDLLFSISVIEHIPDGGDSRAIREFFRVLRPGGIAVIEVPYRCAYEEIFALHHHMNETGSANQPTFYERHYDEAALADRLLEQRPFFEVKRRYVGERIPGLRLYERFPHQLTIPFLPLDVPMALLNLHECPMEDARSITLVLKKPGTLPSWPALVS